MTNLNRYASYQKGDIVLCHKNSVGIKTKEKHIWGKILEVKEFLNSLDMRDYKYEIEFDKGLIKSLLEREILCSV